MAHFVFAWLLRYSLGVFYKLVSTYIFLDWSLIFQNFDFLIVQLVIPNIFTRDLLIQIYF